MEYLKYSNIFPPEILNHTAEHQVARHSTRSQAIYIVLLLVITGTFVSLPFINVDVTVQSQGIIRPSNEITSINSPVNGQIEKLFFLENEHVEKGDTLFVLESNHLNQKQNTSQERLKEINQLLNDLKVLSTTLTKSAFNKIEGFNTPLYAQQYNEFKQKIFELNTAYIKAKRDLDRSKELLDAKAIAPMEYENTKFEFDQAFAVFNNYHQSQLTTWANDVRRLQEEKTRIKADLSQVAEESNDYVIISPVTGTIQGVKGLAEGSILLAGKELFSISPDTDLLVETYISPKDIGLLKAGTGVKYQVDAFNYNQWGFATGEIREISNDIVIQNDQPVFIVKCSMDQKKLTLKNGYEGHLKKGMTTQARFIITERSLWQLLYDKVDDWLNPNG